MEPHYSTPPSFAPSDPFQTPPEWTPHLPVPFPDVTLPPLPADANEELLKRLRDFADRHGIGASQPELASDRGLYDPLGMVASHLQKRGMHVTRNAQMNDVGYDLLATKSVDGNTVTLGVTIAFERTMALSPDTVALTVRRQAIFQDCTWVKNNIDTIWKGMQTAGSYTSES
jgi:hypothetical protein